VSDARRAAGPHEHDNSTFARRAEKRTEGAAVGEPELRLQHLVRDAARRTPSALAVAGPDGSVDYGTLDAGADRCARALAALGVVAGDRVGVWLPSSVRAVTATQGALRLGAAYVPVDPLVAPARAARLLADCAARAVVTTAERAAALAAAGCPAVALTGWEGPEFAGGPLPEPPVGADDPAYLLYTSGSTGDPKGVCLSHRNALAFVEWAAGELRPGPGDRFANHAPLHFDLSVLDLYVAFGAGASVHMVPPGSSYAPARLVDFLTGERITVWYSVPSVLVLMLRSGGLLDVPADRLALRALLFAGEPFPLPALRALRGRWPGVRFLNLYGPTETNVCTWYEVPVDGVPPDEAGSVPIGSACSGDEVWAERPDGTRAGPGESGELVVAGPSVMLGYWGREPLGGRPYRTGDLVTVLPDGGFRYRGRRDAMVKVRGFRVEPGEIEAALRTLPGVADAAVTVAGAGVAARLVAFVVPAPDAPGGRPPGLLEVKRHCAERLPRHMIVDALRVVEALPLTRNGKVDRRALAERAAQAPAAAAPVPGPVPGP
jgi:clorobiocin biosynthesis protein CloN4